ncbi:ABC transporter ATP-binding protein [Flexilinea flocculi]|mgnify:CR=1 FL=1|jgi:branched-chain amino acid transport system ATP-binding protein|uniref:Amino acid/amide ABC transporter ATP-binding protein 2, HAAT family n=1 Tax=Flexilinea flocculi TaxID=1678840 RepID=A0A0S7BVN0_9CHLR|nr:ABC transporter ATP-binding protein [Flexilinea flocculi]NMB92981.1 ABC transporter ATP-binding protein [Flexilinea flocculi]GAP40531.1 amino acid/amide ABC transporter ATP-binding protein 2, HAAT family [Flexilinea flocculi]
MYFEIKDLQVYYRAIHALKGISLTVNKGEIVALIGGNGAGKSSTLNSISGLVQGQSGVITYKDEVITGLPTDMIVKKGIIQVPEGRHIFPKLTVQENLEMGAFLNDNKAQVEEDMEHVYQLFPRMRERRTQPGGTLSGGEQQMLAIGRGLMGHPDLMLLDEPSMGLAPILVEQIFDIIFDINQTGTSILLVEQNAQMALAIADRGYVLETGEIVVSGTGQELLNDPKVQAAYLGGESEQEKLQKGDYYF